MQKEYRALEFFSGIGAFAQVSKLFETEVIHAFDQGQDANSVYELNYNHRPSSRNLDSIKLDQIDKVDIWWMSPPCLPYTRKGNGADVQDPRSHSFLNLTNLVAGKLPDRIFIENVPEFKNSKAMQLLENTLEQAMYSFKTFDLCSSQLGIPMLRRRFFLAASRCSQIEDIEIKSPAQMRELSDFINSNDDDSLYLDEFMLSKLDAFDIVSESSMQVTCFTSSYGKQHKASGSLLRTKDNRIRYFAAEEIVALLGFSPNFKFPRHMKNQTKWRLAGNSVDTRLISLLLEASGLKNKNG